MVCWLCVATGSRPRHAARYTQPLSWTYKLGPSHSKRHHACVMEPAVCKATQWTALQRITSLAYALQRLQWLGPNLHPQVSRPIDSAYVGKAVLYGQMNLPREHALLPLNMRTKATKLSDGCEELTKVSSSSVFISTKQRIQGCQM